MDILIKSFNRPFYLERCLISIHQYVKGYGSIIILDDGTPPEYLKKISKDFPQVNIVHSILYEQKMKALLAHLNLERPYPKFPVPTDSLLNAVNKCSEEFLLLEDDMWFTASIDLSHVQQEMQKGQFVLVKLFWQGNQNFIRGKKMPINEYLEELVPSLPFVSKVIFMNRYKADKILPILYKTKISSVLYRLGILKDESELKWPLYTIFSIAAAVYNKRYFINLLQGAPSVFDELYQLRRAVQWVEKHKSRFAKTTKQLMDTSYICSTYNNFTGINLDLIRLLHYVNQAWLKNQFDVKENFPKDFHPEYIKQFIEKANDEACHYEEWVRWIERFKGQYRGIGCVVE